MVFYFTLLPPATACTRPKKSHRSQDYTAPVLRADKNPSARYRDPNISLEEIIRANGQDGR